MESWLPIPGWEDWYEVSDLGRVRSLPRRLTYGGRMRQGKVLSPGMNSDGYLTVVLCKDARRLTVAVHRLVALAFLGPRPPGQEVRHLDGTRTNNALPNLSYGTRSQNQIDSVQHGTHLSARKTHCLRGHLFTPENTYISPRSGQRDCRICRAIRRR
jgi:NUMOD4 motif/HNH endonuclease